MAGSTLPSDPVRVAVRVRPGASRNRVGGSYGEPPILVVAVSARAVDGAANAAVFEALAEAFNVKTRALHLVSGHTARTKVIEISQPPDEFWVTHAHLLGQ